MGRLAIRHAVAEYIANAGLPYVGHVYAARPEIANETDYELNRFNEVITSQSGSGTVLVTNIPADRRQRRADTGRGAVNDSRIHDIVLEVWFANVSGDGVKAQEDYDTVIDSIVGAVRANATLDAQGTVWSAGEYAEGVKHTQREPTTNEDGTTVFIFGDVRFEAWEWISGPV